jgi:hypothetical protein
MCTASGLNTMSKGFSEHTEPRLHDHLGEPIVHLVMQADNGDERKLRILLELTAASIRNWRDVPRLAKDGTGTSRRDPMTVTASVSASCCLTTGATSLSANEST